jgi:Lon protease-like protein
MTLLPIFYYNETLFPGGRLDLHLFEPRYRVMMQRVVNSTRSFAYVANFNQYRASVGDVALVAVLEEVEFMADGRCMLQAKLSSRMVITEHYGMNWHQCDISSSQIPCKFPNIRLESVTTWTNTLSLTHI